MMRPGNALSIVMMVWALSIGLAAASEKPTPVRGQGCVSSGVEQRCLLIRDLKTGKLYSLIFKGIQPAAGVGIEFEAVPHQGPSTCMQGIALDVIAWEHKTTLKCKPAGTRKE